MSPEDPRDDRPSDGNAPIGDDDLHGWVDGQLTPERRAQVERHLAAQPADREKVDAWRRQNALLHALLDPVLSEPSRLPWQPRAPALVASWRLVAAGVVIAIVSAGTAWIARGFVDREGLGVFTRAERDRLPDFARRAAVAHAIYSAEPRRPVEAGFDHEQQLVTWLSRRLGAAIQAPALQPLGYELLGGRLLPGGSGPVAQLMYHDRAGQRLTVYVTREVRAAPGEATTAFQFGRDGPLNVFYWVDPNFGYAISGSVDRAELTRVASEVYRQLAPK